ncbi:hypothetical protein D3C74_425010 [compost metagenome]
MLSEFRVWNIVFGRNEMCQNLRTVNASPVHRIVWNLVGIIPGNFGRHKIIDPALAHNLRHRCAITEYIRQPEHTVLYAEFFLEETFAIDNLTDHRFTRDQVTICFQPHRTFCFPAAFGHFFFDFLI